MSYLGLSLTIYSSINFLILLWLEYKIYQEIKKDDSMDLHFAILIILKIMEKYNFQILDFLTYFSIRARCIILLHLESLENSLNIIGEETEFCMKIKKRFNNIIN